MPILDLKLQYSLLNQISATTFISKENEINFFLKYLLIASQNIYRNIDTTEYSIRFRNDLIQSIESLIKYFSLKLSLSTNIQYVLSDNYYKYIYKQIKKKCKVDFQEIEGTYFISSDEYNTPFFKPLLDQSCSRDWYFTTYPIAILCLSHFDDSKSEQIKIDFLTQLEVDLLSSSGYTLVLCIQAGTHFKGLHESVFNMILNNQFAEIHFNILDTFESNCDHKYFNYYINQIHDIYDELDCYFYLYIQTLNTALYDKHINLKSLMKKPRFKCLIFSYDTISIDLFKKVTPFYYCKNGFDDDKICIRLSNVPIYDNESKSNTIPSNISGSSIAFISKKDFLHWPNKRIKIILKIEENLEQYEYKYVDFDDVHAVNPGLYLNFDMAKLGNETMMIKDSIESQINSIIMSKKKNFKLENISNLYKNKKIEKVLAYVSFVFCYLANNLSNNPLIQYNQEEDKIIFKNDYKLFTLHDNQIFTALQACKNFFPEEKDLEIKDDCDDISEEDINDELDEKNNNNNGIVFQVETGEGKSIIIQLIAAVLALMNKTVHIASSNITLANRDYYESFKFFKKLGLKSAVLLHYDELPYINEKNKSYSDQIEFNQEYWPNNFFDKSLFLNSANMNFSVCGIGNNNRESKNKANIIFSTVVNFECFYLHIMEMFPSYIYTYFQKCSLLLDEADSILIDELTNGTILSKSIKTNGKEVLMFVYKSYFQKKNPNEVLKIIKEKWPKCTDLNLFDVEKMYQEIELVNKEEYSNGKKYSIETYKIDEKRNLNELLNDTIDNAKNKLMNFFRSIRNKTIKKEELEELYFEEEEDVDTSIKKQIIPFDYDHNGILETNKEFGGFIQQFAAIKEMLTDYSNRNMVIKDASMNYLYVSHPIFVSLYNKICGLTGTVGDKYDNQIFINQYNLMIQKIPRQNPNLRINFPILLCDDIEEKNKRIVTEVLHFNKMQYPVLVIFQDLNEIIDVFLMLISCGIKNINIFDGKDETIKPDKIAGVKGAVSLGTNVCGRGTNIKDPENSLHVIVAFYSSNVRVMEQAFGRTARQGKKGSARVICLKEQFISPIEIINENEMITTLNALYIKNIYQIKFIEKFREKRSWIFSGEIKNQKLTPDVIKTLREAKINVNRKNAFNYEFPICMSIESFLDIQSQKIFSLYNCPNCKYTWMLFQKYLREMILETWSLLIEKVDNNYDTKSKITYKDYLEKETQRVFNLLEKYLPDSTNENDYDIVPTYINIFKQVQNQYQSEVLSVFPDHFNNALKQYGTNRFCSFTFGFKPFSLISESGAKINTIEGNDSKQSFIKDPELKYMRRKPTGLSLLSITEKIDGILDWICNKINEIIGAYIGLRFFLRRTLGGCEFGICYDANITTKEIINHCCIVDKDPLLVFTITVKSEQPVLAGILIIGLVYIASIAKSIYEWIVEFPFKVTKKIIRKTLKEVASVILSSQIDSIVEKVCDFLKNIMLKDIESIKSFSPCIGLIFDLLLSSVFNRDFSLQGDKISETFCNLFEGKINVAGSFLCENIPFAGFLKIGLMLLMCFSAFMMNFYFCRKSIKYNSDEVALRYDKKQNEEEALNNNKKFVKQEKIDKIDEDCIDVYES